MSLNIFWFIPTHGDGRYLGTSEGGRQLDHRYLQRIILPAAAAFIEGFGSAVAQTDSTTVDTGSGTTVSEQSDLNTHQELLKGVAEGAGKLSEILDDQADVDPQLRVRTGTQMGILFLQAVTRDDAG